jgi:Cytochrome P460
VKKIVPLPLATAVFACSFSLWAQLDDTAPFPKEFRKWAHVKSVLVGAQSAAYATEGGIHHIYANEKALVGYDTGKFPNGSVIVYDFRSAVSLPRVGSPPGRLINSHPPVACHAKRKDHDLVFSEFRK